MTWPQSDHKRQGLLPDIYNLQNQHRDGPAINPGTVGAHIGQAYSKGKMYDLKKLKDKGWFIHAPCAIDLIEESKSDVRIRLNGWGNKPYHVLISGLKETPAKISLLNENAHQIKEVSTDTTFHKGKAYMTVRLKGKLQLRLK